MFYKILKYLKFFSYNFYLFLSHALLNKKKKKKKIIATKINMICFV